MSVDYTAVMAHLHPGKRWVVSGNSYAGVAWYDEGTKPTKATLDSAWPDVHFQQEVERIRGERQSRYLKETDPLFMKAMRDEEDGVTMADWKDAVAQIKAELPYPEAP